MAQIDDIAAVFEEGIDKFLIAGGRRELKDQGHIATGRLAKSLQAEIAGGFGSALVALIYGEEYGADINERRPPSAFPGSYQLAIELQASGWIDAVLRGAPEIEKRKFGIRVARKIKQVGSPTPGSFKFSTNGRRTGWIEHGIGGGEEDLLEFLDKEVFKLFQANIDRAIRGE